MVCTHSMAPWSVPERLSPEAMGRCRQIFTAARQRLVTTRPTVFEEAWHSLSSPGGLPYPSSAVFAQHLWQGDLSLLLCESYLPVYREIDGWLQTPEIQDRLHGRIHSGTWRDALQSPISTNEADIVLVEMDPMRYDHRDATIRQSSDDTTLYPEDIELLVRAIAQITKPIVLQISSFSTGRTTSLEQKAESLNAILAAAGFVMRYQIAVGRGMVSFVFSRNCGLPNDDLGTAFAEWLSGIH